MKKIFYLLPLLVCTAWGTPSKYTIVVSEKTVRNPAWAKVVKTLHEKHNAQILVYPAGKISEVLPELQKHHPRYAAFVAKPEELGRNVVVTIHRITRQLDDDPYTDLRWGIITGYNAADALRIAKRSQPLIVKSMATSIDGKTLAGFDHGFASSENDAHAFWIKRTGKPTEKLAVIPDPVKALVESFNTQPPDLFYTSGHATTKNWQIGYTVRAGHFRCEDGQLYGLSTTEKRYDINSPHPKIYMPCGNCLIGNIPDKNCMTTAWLHSGGVLQMFGYTAVTFHGYMGWGIKTYFENQYSLADAFFFNNQALIWELQKEFPDQANINFTTYETSDIQRMAQKFKLTSRKLLGHLWDRDVVAFYGDPAWEARLPLTDPAWSFTFTHTGENVVIEITAQKDGTWGDRPLAIPFPQRLGGIRLVSCTPKTDVLVTDDFALIDLAGKTRKAGETIRLQFGAHPLDSKPTTKKRPTLAALYFAGKNRAALTQALEKSSGATRDDLTFLIANMPLRDLKNLAPDFLLENIQYAQKARAEAPWKTRITDELYREYILPYANLSETRDPWRKDFYTRFKPLVANISEPGEAAIKLNTTIYDLLNVHYHATKRPRPDQSPAESIQATYASCSGLSILLVDACRAVGIPARVAGVAQWTKGPGNHTWVEIWDGQWHCIGAAESKALDDVWFGTGAAQADASQPFKRIYAAKFSRDTLYFPMVWNPYAHYVPAVDVTARYKKQFKKP